MAGLMPRFVEKEINFGKWGKIRFLKSVIMITF